MFTEKSKSWQENETVSYHIRFMRSTGVPDALNSIPGTPTAYIKQAILEKLERDGLIKPGSVPLKGPGRYPTKK